MENEHQKVKENATGALWLLEDKADESREAEKDTGETGGLLTDGIFFALATIY